MHKRRQALRQYRKRRLRLVLVTGGILLALGLTVVLLRFHRLSEVPAKLDWDEAAHGVDALQVLQGEHALFFRENHGREGLLVYAVALCVSFLGRTVLAIRLPTALAGAGTVFVVFWLGRLLFGRDEENEQDTQWRGLLVGGVGAGLLAVSLGQTIIGRTAMRGNLLLFLLPLCFALLWEGHKLRSWWRILLAGVCAGLLPYTYIAARFALLLFVFFGLSFLLTSRSAGKVKSHIELLRQNLPYTGVFVVVAGLIAAPILIHFLLHPGDFVSRSSEVSIFGSDRNQGNSLGVFLINAWEYLLLFVFSGDPSWERNLSGRPMLHPWEAFFFWLGTAMAIRRGRPAHLLLLLWLVTLILPAILSRDVSHPNTLRMIGVMPAVYLLIGVGVWETFRFMKQRSSALQWRINEYVLGGGTMVGFAVIVVVGVVLIVQGVNTYRSYFNQWALHHSIHDSNEVWIRKLVQALNEPPADDDMIYLVPSFSWNLRNQWHYSLRYLYTGEASLRVTTKAERCQA